MKSYTLLQVGTQGGAQISRPFEITLFYHQENFIFKFLARVPKHQHCLEKQLLSIYRQILHSGLKIVIIRINKASRMSNKNEASLRHIPTCFHAKESKQQ